jgi:hypothetical protein
MRTGRTAAPLLQPAYCFTVPRSSTATRLGAKPWTVEIKTRANTWRMEHVSSFLTRDSNQSTPKTTWRWRKRWLWTPYVPEEIGHEKNWRTGGEDANTTSAFCRGFTFCRCHLCCSGLRTVLLSSSARLLISYTNPARAAEQRRQKKKGSPLPGIEPAWQAGILTTILQRFERLTAIDNF